MNNIDVDDVFAMLATTRKTLLAASIEYALVFPPNVMDSLMSWLSRTLLQDNETPLNIRQMALETATAQWCARLSASRNSNRTQEYRNKCSQKIKDIEFILNDYEQAVKDLTSLSVRLTTPASSTQSTPATSNEQTNRTIVSVSESHHDHTKLLRAKYRQDRRR